jgi:1-acyl-sn-glycerol-3-phosphate acyltransferase
MILNKIKAYYVVFEFLLTVGLDIVFMYILGDKHRKARRTWAKLQRYLIGYDIKTYGRIDENAQMLIINHQSILDIVALEDIHPKDLAWVAKKEIGDIFFFGHILKAPKMIQVDRDDKRSIITLLKDVKDRVESGRVVAIFPEGTRGKGDKLLKFKDGAKIVAQKLNLKVQPVVIEGSRDVMDSHEMIVKSGTVQVSFLETIESFEEGWYENVREKMKQELLRLKEQRE